VEVSWVRFPTGTGKGDAAVEEPFWPRRRKNRNIRRRRTKNRTPPTTPPTIGPMGAAFRGVGVGEGTELCDPGMVVVIVVGATLLPAAISMSNRSKVIRETPLKLGSGSFRSMIWCTPNSGNLFENRRS